MTILSENCAVNDCHQRELRAEIERLKAAWRWADPHLESLRAYRPDPDFDIALAFHRAALKDTTP